MLGDVHIVKVPVLQLRSHHGLPLCEDGGKRVSSAAMFFQRVLTPSYTYGNSGNILKLQTIIFHIQCFNALRLEGTNPLTGF